MSQTNNEYRSICTRKTSKLSVISTQSLIVTTKSKTHSSETTDICHHNARATHREMHDFTCTDNSWLTQIYPIHVFEWNDCSGMNRENDMETNRFSICSVTTTRDRGTIAQFAWKMADSSYRSQIPRRLVE